MERGKVVRLREDRFDEIMKRVARGALYPDDVRWLVAEVVRLRESLGKATAEALEKELVASLGDAVDSLSAEVARLRPFEVVLTEIHERLATLRRPGGSAVEDLPNKGGA